MPAIRKTEPLPARKSETATARFVLADPDPDDDPAFDPPTTIVSSALHLPSQPAAPAQSKDKEKDAPAGAVKDKDAVAIEVRPSRMSPGFRHAETPVPLR